MEKAHTNLKAAVYVTFFTAGIFVFLFLFIGINDRKYAYEDSKLLAKEISRKEAIETEVYLSSALMVARSIEQKTQIIREVGFDRKKVVNLLKSTVGRNPNFLAAWTMWEPNAFDGNDKQFIGDTLYDENGTMCVCFFKYKNTLLFERNNPSDYFEDYYTIPKKTRSELLIDPFYYQYHGHPYFFYETSLVVPVIVDSVFLGVFGIDINLDNLKNKLNQVKLYKSGYLSLISNSGVIVSHADTSFVERNLFSLVNDKDSIAYKAIKEGRELSIETISEFTNLKVFRFFYPIKIGNGNTPWSMMVEIPISEATTRSKQLLTIAFAILFLGLSLLAYLILNIIDRKRYEKALLLAMQQAEKSNEIKTAFLNNISHEIRTPLNGIVGFSELLITTDSTIETKRNFNEIIKSSSNQLISLISNVLELSKIQSGDVKILITDVFPAKSIDIIILTYTKAAEDKGLEIIIKYPPNSSKIIIQTDEEKLRQVLSNLINNAIKFTDLGSLEIGFEEKENTLLFYVKDTGIGIDPDQAKQVYDMFNQADISLSRKYGGAGIGLAIAKAYIERLGGKIWLHSEIEKGTTFYFALPYIKPNELTLKNPIEDKLMVSKPITILVAEDEVTNFFLIQEILNSKEIKLLWAKNGLEAIELCRNDITINMVLMDIKMPTMNGYEATRIIKQEHKGLPVIAVTAYVQNDEQLNQQTLFDSIIAKPFRIDELLSTIKKYS